MPEFDHALKLFFIFPETTFKRGFSQSCASQFHNASHMECPYFFHTYTCWHLTNFQVILDHHYTLPMSDGICSAYGN